MNRLRFVTISLCACLIAAAWGFIPGGGRSLAEAADSIDFSRFVITGDETGSVAVTKNSLTVKKAESADRVNFIATSRETFDFSKDFSFQTQTSTSAAPDGLTITFQPEKNFSYESGTGSSLLVYNIREEDSTAGTYAEKALVTEFDTFDSRGVGQDTEQIVRNAGFPHLAIATTDGNGKGTPRAACGFTAGSSQSLTIRWEVTDENAGTGTYSVKYGSREISYEGFSPKDFFGTEKVFLSVTGALNFESGYGGAGDTWKISLEDFQYADPEPVSRDCSARVTENGEKPSGKNSYSFCLEDEKGEVLQTVKAKNGDVSFQPVTFEKEGLYRYKIRQKKGSVHGVTYDDTEYAVKFDVTRNGNALAAEVSYEKDGTSVKEALFKNKVYGPELSIEETRSKKTVSAEDKVVFTLTVTNNGKGDAEGIWIRRYMPKYMNFYSVDKKGEYGCVDQKEYANWFIDTPLEYGESLTLTFTAEAHACLPENYKPNVKVYYQDMEGKEFPYASTAKNPSEVTG